MPVIVNLDVMLAQRKMTLSLLSKKVDISPVNLSMLKSGNAMGIKFSTLSKLCLALDCRASDILEIVSKKEYRKRMGKSWEH
jgi:putative transcriptional regulator